MNLHANKGPVAISVSLEVQVAVFGLEKIWREHEENRLCLSARFGQYFNRLAREKSLPLRATTAGPEPDAEVPANVVAGMKTRGIDVHAYRPTLIAAEQLTDAELIVSFACDAGRKLAPDKAEERWDDCPAVSDDFDVAWDFITSRVETLVGRLSK